MSQQDFMGSGTIQETARENAPKKYAQPWATEQSTTWIKNFLMDVHEVDSLHPEYEKYLDQIECWRFEQVGIDCFDHNTLVHCDREKIDRYKNLDWSDVPPVLLTQSLHVLDGCHRIVAAMELQHIAVAAYVACNSQS